MSGTQERSFHVFKGLLFLTSGLIPPPPILIGWKEEPHFLHAMKTAHSAFQHHPRQESHSSKMSPQLPIPDSREVLEDEGRSLS